MRTQHTIADANATSRRRTWVGSVLLGGGLIGQLRRVSPLHLILPPEGAWRTLAARDRRSCEPRRQGRRSRGRLARRLAAVLAFGAAAPLVAQQVADTAFSPPVDTPEYAPGRGPIVAIDAAHLNFHTAGGRYLAFAKLLRRDGYDVESNTQPFTRAALSGIDILVIANALHPQSEADWAPLPNLPAFTDAEVAAVEAWVREGGSLLLIADHMPLAGHAESLAAAFGVRFQNGFALDAAGRGRVTFRRSDGSLTFSSVANGRSLAERVDSVTAFTGQAFRVDSDVDAEPLLVLPEGYTLFLPQVAWEFSDSTPRIPAAHLLQGALARHGRGRIVVFGEAAMFSAQLAGPQRVPVGMNEPAAGENYRFALNVIHWLNGRLD